MDSLEAIPSVLLILLAWCLLSLPVGVFIGRMIAFGNPVDELTEQVDAVRSGPHTWSKAPHHKAA